MKRVRKYKYAIYSYPTIIFLILLTVFPLVYSVIISLTDYGILNNGTLKFIFFDNYKQLFNNTLFQTALKNTLILLIFCVIIECTIGSLLAFSFFYLDFKSRKWIQTLIIIPLAIAPVAIALMWKFIFNSTYGVMNYLINFIGVNNIDWLGDKNISFISIAIVDIWQWSSFIFIILLAGIESIPKRSIEMAKSDGANYWQLFKYIILPNSLPFFMVALLIRIIDFFKIFDIIYVLTDGGPGSATETMSLYGFRLGFRFFNTGLASAESIIILIIVTILIFFLNKIFSRIIQRY